VERPITRFAWNGDVSLAYQVVGEGPDLLYLQGYCSQIDMNWDSPHLTRFLQGLARQARLIITDRRGWGCSERFSPGHVADVDALTDDIGAVLEAAGSERATIVATFESTLVASLFAAAYPERTHALILIDPFVTYAATAEMPWMPTAREWEEAAEEIRAEWGTDAWTRDWPETPEADWFRRYMRASITPGGLAAEMRRYMNTDIHGVLPTIQVPTLVMGDLDGVWEVPPETARHVADLIPGAQLAEHSSAGGLHRMHWYGRAEPILEEIRRFLARIQDEELSFDRVLATVLFTDIVGSTEQATELGDKEWTALVHRHHAAVRTLLARYRGKEIDTAGDGFFATFDGPARAARCAQAIVDAVRPLGLTVRAGLHTGEVETGGEKVTGVAVSIGARVAALAGPSEVLVSQTVRDLVTGSGLTFEDRGEHELKGVPGRWRVFGLQGQP
jgi:class 3 adenylate cyclase